MKIIKFACFSASSYSMLLPNRTLALRGQSPMVESIASFESHLWWAQTRLVRKSFHCWSLERLKNFGVLKTTKSLSNKTAWMTSAISEAYLRRQDQKFQHEKRKVFFIVDNCPSHSTLRDLKAIEPKNTKSRHQSMYAGVISILKTQYLTHLVKQKLLAYNTDLAFKIHFLRRKLWTILTLRIRHSWRKSERTNKGSGKRIPEPVKNSKMLACRTFPKKSKVTPSSMEMLWPLTPKISHQTSPLQKILRRQILIPRILSNPMSNRCCEVNNTSATLRPICRWKFSVTNRTQNAAWFRQNGNNQKKKTERENWQLCCM